MGNDGGSIPKRDEMVSLKKTRKEKPLSQGEQHRIKWSFCALTETLLQPPIVCDELGNLFNKEQILTTLLRKTRLPEEFNHIRGLKDLITLQLTQSPGESASSPVSFICPITLKEVGSLSNKFVAIRPCGCVLAQSALEAVVSDTCLACNQPFSKVRNLPLTNVRSSTNVSYKKKHLSVAQESVILLNGSESEIETLRTQMIAKRLSQKSKKKKTKAKEGGSLALLQPCADSSDSLSSDQSSESILARPIKRRKEREEPSDVQHLPTKKKKTEFEIPENADPEVYKSLFKPIEIRNNNFL